MTWMQWRLVMVLATLLSTTAVVSGQPAPAAASAKRALKQGPVKAAAGVPQAVIAGTVVDQNSLPLADARVRLRNLQTREIEQESTTNTRGEFMFVAKPEIPYVVELVDRSNQILAVGEVIVVRAREVAGTLVSAPARIPGISHLFGNTAGAVVAAVSGLGITAFDSQNQPPVSPEK
jgi:hypothetical protein